MHLDQHFTILIYPFQHELTGRQRQVRLQRLNQYWPPWWQRLDTQALKRTLDDTYFFLPIIRTLLFPETQFLQVGDASAQVTEAQRLTTVLAHQLAARLYATDGVLRLTYADAFLQALQPLFLTWERHDAQGHVSKRLDPPAPLCLDHIDVLLFPQGIGLLLLNVRLNETLPTVDRLNDVLYHLRFVLKPTIDWELPQWECHQSTPPLRFTSRTLVDYLLQGFTKNSADVIFPTLTAWCNHFETERTKPCYSDSELGQTYGQSFRLYSFVSLDSTGSGVASTSADTPFASPVERALYELATCTQTSDSDYVPHPCNVAPILDAGHITLWNNWQGLVLHDSSVFLVHHPSGFTRNVLAHNVGSDYLHLYLLTLYQQMRLSMLSNELHCSGTNLYRDLRKARNLWTEFLMFRNTFWFSEVTSRPQGTALYHRFQSGMNVLMLYQSMAEEMRELQGYYEARAQRDINDVLNLIALFGFPAGILTQLYRSDLIPDQRHLFAWSFILVSIILIGCLIRRLWQQR